MTTPAQWIAAFGTVGGAVATTVAVALAYLGLRREVRRANDQRDLDVEQRDRDRAEHLDRQAAQARLVLVTVDPVLPPGPNPVFVTGTHPQGEVHVLLHNQSQEPVLVAALARVLLRTRRQRADGSDTDPVEPAQRWELHPEYDPDTGPIAAGAEHRWQIIVLRPGR